MSRSIWHSLIFTLTSPAWTHHKPRWSSHFTPLTPYSLSWEKTGPTYKGRTNILFCWYYQSVIRLKWNTSYYPMSTPAVWQRLHKKRLEKPKWKTTTFWLRISNFPAYLNLQTCDNEACTTYHTTDHRWAWKLWCVCLKYAEVTNTNAYYYILYFTVSMETLTISH